MVELVRAHSPMSVDDVIIKKDGKLIWLSESWMALTEPLDDSKIDLKINLPPQEQGPGEFGLGEFIATYIELEDITNGYLIKQDVYKVVGSLIIDYYKAWKWRVSL